MVAFPPCLAQTTVARRPPWPPAHARPKNRPKPASAGQPLNVWSALARRSGPPRAVAGHGRGGALPPCAPTLGSSGDAVARGGVARPRAGGRTLRASGWGWASVRGAWAGPSTWACGDLPLEALERPAGPH